VESEWRGGRDVKGGFIPGGKRWKRGKKCIRSFPGGPFKRQRGCKKKFIFLREGNCLSFSEGQGGGGMKEHWGKVLPLNCREGGEWLYGGEKGERDAHLLP